MRIDNQDIIRTAQQLRDEENQRMNVSPWNRHRNRFRVPAWLVAIPAATIIGFVLGLWTRGDGQNEEPMTALVDTVYIKVHDPQPQQDSVVRAVTTEQTPAVPNRVARPATRVPTTSHRQQPAFGRPVTDDHIRYDLLVRN